MDDLFFTLADVRNVRKSVSTNIDDFDQYAVEVQRNYVEKLIGAKLYAELQADLVGGVPQAQRFIDLVDGKQYLSGGRTVIFRGIKLYACYLWLHIHMGMSGVEHTPIGTMMFKDDAASANEVSQMRRNAADHFIKSADQLEEPTLKFLRENISTYPEFTESNQVEQAERDNVSFKAMGTTYRDPYNNLY